MSDDESVFKALASPVRREILVHLRRGELAAGDIASKFDIAAPTISRHLGVLKGAGLVAERRQSNRILYSIVQETIAATLNDFLGTVTPPRQGARSKQRRREAG